MNAAMVRTTRDVSEQLPPRERPRPRPASYALVAAIGVTVAVLCTGGYRSLSVALATWVFSGVLSAAVVSDVATGRVPNAVVACAFFVVVVAIVAVVVDGEVSAGQAVARVGLSQVASGTVALGVLWLVRPQLVGGGDVKMLSVAAAMVGLASPPATAVVGATAAVAHAVAAAVARRRSLPFAPALVVGLLAGIGFASWEAGR